eukprot:135983-Alexandrium_andersonii.AAC.1
MSRIALEGGRRGPARSSSSSRCVSGRAGSGPCRGAAVSSVVHARAASSQRQAPRSLCGSRPEDPSPERPALRHPALAAAEPSALLGCRGDLWARSGAFALQGSAGCLELWSTPLGSE